MLSLHNCKIIVSGIGAMAIMPTQSLRFVSLYTCPTTCFACSAFLEYLLNTKNHFMGMQI
jgi:hypothetical protein